MTKHTDRILIIPAAGAGVRFRELGKNYPKCVLPVKGTPIIVSAINELAERTGAFTKVIVAAGSVEHADAISAALAPANFKTNVNICIVAVPENLSPSPAVSLDQVLHAELGLRQGCDFDVTVFLSDMLPASKSVADSVIDMPTNTWGVVENSPDDYKRWCMVDNKGDRLEFYDKPETKPETNLAAVGVYRYRSAWLLRSSFLTVVKTAENFNRRELQFSDVATVYQTIIPLRAMLFRSYQFTDFGTLESYLANKGINKTRSFNSIIEQKYTVTKFSEQYDKMRDESVWMQNAPKQLQRFVPKIESVDLMRGRFVMEKIRSSNMRDIALYLDRSYEAWVEIFGAIRDFMTSVESTGLPADEAPHGNDPFWLKMRDKTVQRALAIEVLDLPEDVRHWLGNRWVRVANELMSLDYEDDRVCYYHGDLHFANMFYCFHYKDLKVIDPRGEMRGSMLYDLAKLCHSVYGRYDYIDADLYSMVGDQVVFYDKGHNNIERAFEDVLFNHLTDLQKYLVLQLTASLFLSMIPLHEENAEHCRLFLDQHRKMIEKSEVYAKSLDIGV